MNRVIAEKAVILMCALVLPLSTIFGALIFADDAANVKVLVHYYPSYNPYKNADGTLHWPDGYLRSILDPNPTSQVPVLGEYSSRDLNIIQQHIAWSEEYGIDAWICDWRGFAQGESGDADWADVTIKDNIMPLLKGSKVKFCVSYDPTGLLGKLDDNGQLIFDNIKIGLFTESFNYLAKTYFNNDNYLKINGSPVVFIYLSRTFTGDYQKAISAARDEVRKISGCELYLVGDEICWDPPVPERIALFNAITSYGMCGNNKHDGYPDETGLLNDIAAQFSLYKKAVGVLNCNGLKVDFIPNVMPGFNDKGYRPGQEDLITPRQVNPGALHTSTFSNMCDRANSFLTGTQPMVTIMSWNNWREDTQIEPACVTDPANMPIFYTGNGKYYYKGYGTDYLKIIREKFSTISIELNESTWTINSVNLGEKRTNYDLQNPFAGPIHIVKNTGNVPVKIGFKYVPQPYNYLIVPGLKQDLNTFITMVSGTILPVDEEITLPYEIQPGASQPLPLTYGAPTALSQQVSGMSAAYEIRVYKNIN